MKLRPQAAIFFTVFIDLVGFGMIIPLNPYLARQFGADAAQVGWLMTIYSLMQLVFSPFWGGLSDRMGRRPIILVSLLGVGLSHLGFAFAGTYSGLFMARLLAGFFGANISTAMAYIADITPAKDRSKGMGLIGAAFGLGFLVGPFLGGILGHVGDQLGAAPPFGPSFAAIVAGLFCLFNVVFSWRCLPESRQPTSEPAGSALKRLGALTHFMGRPVVGPLMFLYFISSFAMAHMEASLFMFVQDRFQWTLMQASFGFAYIGVMMVLTQGVLIRRLLPRWGESRVLLMGQVSSTLGFLGMAFAPNIPWLTLAVTFLGLGSGCISPSLSGSISLLTGKDEQGKALGVNQSLSALGRILGPVTGGYLYLNVQIVAPFLMAGGLMAFGLVIALLIAPRLPSSEEPSHV